MPPERLRRVATVESDESAATYRPTVGLKIARGVVETLRLLAPMTSLVVTTLWSLQWIAEATMSALAITPAAPR